MFKKKKIFLIIASIIVLVVIFITYQNSNMKKLKTAIREADRSKIAEIIYYDITESEKEKLMNNKRFSKYLIKILSGYLDNREYDKVVEILKPFETFEIKNDYVVDYCEQYQFAGNENMTFPEKVEFATAFGELDSYYVMSCGITQEEIENYLEENEEIIYTSEGTKGYYDKLENRKSNRYRDIEEDGTIVTEGHQYFGDFMIRVKELEYVDALYEIRTNTSEYFYFRQWNIDGIEMIDDFAYASPYLFSTYEGVTKIFILNPESDVCYKSATVKTGK